MKYLELSLLWSGYCAVHSFLISTSFTKFLSRLLKKYYAFYRLIYVVISFILLVPLINYTSGADTEIIISYTQFWEYIRLGLTYASLLIFFWAFFFNYDSLSFFGIRQIINFFKDRDPDSAGEIKKKGLLGVTRHPMYLALIIFLWCQTFRLTDIIINLLLTIYVIIGTLLEEKKLVLEFGDAYIKYKSEVPMLIPFIRKK